MKNVVICAILTVLFTLLATGCTADPVSPLTDGVPGPYSMGQTASYTVPDEETLDFQAAQEESGIVGMGPCFNPAI